MTEKDIGHVLFDLRTIKGRIRALTRLLDEYERRDALGGSNITLYGSDIRYLKRESLEFVSKLEFLINEHVQKEGKEDLFGRVFQGLSQYIYAELIFSTDFSKISSIRLLSANFTDNFKDSSFAMFGLNNPFDRAIISIIVNLENLTPFNDLKEEGCFDIQNPFKNLDLCNIADSALAFLAANITEPPVRLGPEKATLGILSLGFKTKSDKNFEELNIETNLFEDLQKRADLYKQHALTSIAQGSLEELRKDARRLIDKIKDSGSNCPDDILATLFLELFDKFSLARLIKELIECLCKLALQFLQSHQDIIRFLSLSYPLAELIGLLKYLPCNYGDKILKELGIIINPEIFARNVIERIIEEERRKVLQIEKFREEAAYNPNPITVRIDNILYNSSYLIDKDNKRDNLINLSYDIKSGIDLHDAIEYINKNYPTNRYSQTARIINEELEKYFSANELLEFIFKFCDLKLLLNIVCNGIDIQIPKLTIPTFRIPDLFLDISLSLDDIIILILKSVLSVLGIELLSKLLTLNICDDIVESILISGIGNFVNNPESEWARFTSPSSNDVLKLLNAVDVASSTAAIGLVASPSSQPSVEETKSLFKNAWPQFISEISQILSDMKNIKQYTSGDSSIDDIIEQLGSIKALKNELTITECINDENIIFSRQNLNPNNLNLQKILNDFKNKGNLSDESRVALMDNIKNFQYSEIHDFLITRKEQPDIKIVEILRKMGEKAAAETNPINAQNMKKVSENLQVVSGNIDNIAAGMIGYVIKLLKPKELVDLFAGEYSEQTANIIREVVRLKYPELAAIMDPVKYFIILGKVSGLDGLRRQIIKSA